MVYNVCIICYKNIKPDDKVCFDCSIKKDIMISRSDAIKNYKLTEEEIEKDDIYILHIKGCNYSGKKYFLEDVHDIATKITKDLPLKDPRKKGFLKQESKIGDIIKTKKDKAIRKKKIMDTLQTLALKYDPEYEHDHQVHIKVISMLDQYSDSGIYRNILPFIAKRVERKKDIHNKIPKYNKYKDHIKNIDAYNAMINSNFYVVKNDGSLCKCIIDINTEIDKNINKMAIDKLVKEQIEEQYIPYVEKHIFYRQYVRGEYGDLGLCMQKLRKYITKKKKSLG